jgi:hypothetical protein
MIAALIMLVCAALGALVEGYCDARRISANKPIEHGISWTGRLIAGTGIGWAFVQFLLVPSWHIIPLIGICYGAYSPVFRFTLNRSRVPKFHALYISGSNHYDAFFLRLCGVNHFYYQFSYTHEPSFRAKVHRAGRLCYIVELTALLISGAIIAFT